MDFPCFALWQIACYCVYNVDVINRVYRRKGNMKISQKGLYALQALMMLARHSRQGAIRIRDIAYEENLPEKFLELILLEMKNARIVESVRGAKGGYQLRRPASEIRLSEIIRLIDGPLAPFGDAEHLRELIDRDDNRRALYEVFLDVRDAAAKILEGTTLADLMPGAAPEAKTKNGRKRTLDATLLPMAITGGQTGHD
jgi:Rrf2 family protein